MKNPFKQSSQQKKTPWYKKIDTVNLSPVDAGLKVGAFYYTRKKGTVDTRAIRISPGGLLSIGVRAVVGVVTGASVATVHIMNAIAPKSGKPAKKTSPDDVINSAKESDAKAQAATA